MRSSGRLSISPKRWRGEGELGDGHQRDVQVAHHGAVLRPPDEAAETDRSLLAGQGFRDEAQRGRAGQCVGIRVVVRKDDQRPRPLDDGEQRRGDTPAGTVAHGGDIV